MTTVKTIKTVKKPASKAKALKSKAEVQIVNQDVKPSVNEKQVYVFATGRRKTSIANIRLFEGTGKNMVNKKPLENYFNFEFYRDEILKPLEMTGNKKNKFFIANVSGGGIFSQAQAIRHGLSTALSKESQEIRKILKKNGFLTRDDRKKERKKPGLKRARRAPQWAKR